jgi:hypothetical protein
MVRSEFMKKFDLAYAAMLAVCAGGVSAANAQSVEFRIVERTGQLFLSSGDNVLELAVQAKVTGGNLGAFAFDVVASGEQDTWGSLQWSRISNSDGTYFTGTPWSGGTTVGQHGMAAAYSWFASPSGGNNPAFNGLINASGATFTNTPGSQEIGLITGRLMGAPMLNTPGLDPIGEGNPVTWSGYGAGNTPAFQSLAALPSALGPTYFANGQFVDIYHFNYTVSNLSTIRTLTFGLQNMHAENFTRFVYGPGLWGAQDTTVPAGSISGASLSASVSGFTLLIPTPGTAGVLAMVGACAVRRRRR